MNDDALTFWQLVAITSVGPIGVMIGTAIGWFLFWRPWLKRLEGRSNG